jgi:hypothetical protein
MRQPAFELQSAASRRIVRDAIVRVCEYRSVALYALQVRTNHVHGVVESEDPGRVLHDWKAYATRSLRETGLVGRDRIIMDTRRKRVGVGVQGKRVLGDPICA